MINKVVVLGSTGSVGNSTLKIIEKNKNYKIVLLSANKNINKLLRQAIKFNVKHAIIEDKIKYNNYKNLFNKNKIKLYLGYNNIEKIFKNKITYCINSISGIDGLHPTLKIIPYTEKILIANKESIICGWDIIKKKLDKYKTKFIPIDSEHFSIWKLITNENKKKIDKVILTASGGPFLKKTKKQISNIKPKFALRHPNWKMGKKISIDSATMMNKIFELIEAKKIFNLKKKELSIIIHPSSFIHAIIFFKGNIIKFLAHETNMTIPISNALGVHKKTLNSKIYNQINNLNYLKFEKPKINQFPLLSIVDSIPEQSSFFETILITLNDFLVHKYLKNEINYVSLQLNLLKLIKSPFLVKFYKLKPKNIYDIKKMIKITNNYLKNKIVYYEK